MKSPRRLAVDMSKSRQALNRMQREAPAVPYEPPPSELPLRATINESKARDAIFIVSRILAPRTIGAATFARFYAGVRTLERAQTLAVNLPTRAIVQDETNGGRIVFDNNKPVSEV